MGPMFEAAGPLGWASSDASAPVEEESQMRHEVPEASVGMRSSMSAVLADISAAASAGHRRTQQAGAA